MWSEKWPIRHDSHAQCHPEKHCRQESPAAVVLSVVFEGVFNDPDVDEAADEEDEDCEVVRAPEEGHALVIEIHSLFFLRPTKIICLGSIHK